MKSTRPSTWIRKMVKCSVCGKITAARLPHSGKHKGDGTLWYPRRHDVNGKPCKGNIIEAEIINDPSPIKKKTDERRQED